MRMVFGILGLVFTLAIVGMLAKKQLSAVNAIQVPTVAGSSVGGNPGATNAATAQQQAVQIQQQYKASVEAAMQQTRPMPDDK
jgi:hypothetical protein